MTKVQLKAILAKHKLWRESGGEKGTRANLAGADLARANLADANLAGANLAGAYLADANLADANLAGADLARAYLAGADLARANLAGAYLAGAYLADAYLAGAYLAGAKNVDVKGHVEPTTPYVRPTTPADVLTARRERAAAYRARHPEVPVVEDLDRRILDAITKPGCGLEMGAWHTCETTHCRAGWAIHLAGKAGYALEKELNDPAAAGRAIYLASTGRAPHFYATNARAREDLERCAAESK